MSETNAELDDFDRNLLRAARMDAPGAGAVVRAAAALGLGIGAAAPSVAAAATAARAVSLASMKWTLIGAFGVVSVGTGTVAYLRSSGPEAPAVSAPAAVPERAEAHTATPSEAVTVAPTPAAPPPAPRVGTRPAPESLAVPRTAPPVIHAPVTKDGVAAPPPAAPASTTAAAASGVSIAEEVAAVDRARHALRQGHAGEALDELNRYQARWPKGVLATEVVVLRVEAKLRLGERAAARNEARAFIAAQPGTRYAVRLKELFEPGELD